MNEIIHKNVKRFLAGIGAMVLCFSEFIVPVFAFGSNWESSDLYKSIGYYKGATATNDSNSSSGDNFEYKYKAINVFDKSNNNVHPEVGKVGVVAYTGVSFKDRNNLTANGSNNSTNQLSLLFYSFDDNWRVQGLHGNNNLTWSISNTQYIELSFTANGVQGTGTTVYYANVNTYTFLSSAGWGTPFIKYFTRTFPNIPIVYGVNNKNDILTVISLDSTKEDWPWMYQSSSGGIHFTDGTELDDSNTAIYSNVYTVMDINQDNSISQDEVNYYNITYDTNYDYSSINNNNNFDLYDFLYYVALKINANENPAGEGSGGGDIPTGTGGITVGDGSFTQSQTQSIEQNAVNVTVTNNNELTNENLNHINQIINNNPETTDNTFQDAIGNMNQFRAMAAAFAALAGVVLGWLPSWVTGLIGLSFSILSIMIIFRLIHLFV